jgi:kinesin family protein 5
MSSPQAVTVKVVVRVRPQNKIETARGGAPCVNISDDGTEVDVEDGYNSQKWSFDRVFKPTSRQEDVFTFVGMPVVEAVFKGYNGTIFAYGQTSSGKTHTMTGPDGSLDDASNAGVIPRCVDAIFDGCAEAGENLEFTVQVQFMEIYLERVKDLLDTRKTNLPIREDIASGRGIYVEGITEEYVTSPEDLTELMKTAAANRAVASTGMNAGSSRSHSVTIIRIHQKDTTTGSTKSGKLCLVDLA